MDATEKINKAIIKLWKEHTKDVKPKYIPMFYSPLKNHALLFVGLNPSFGTRWSFLKGTEHEDVWQNPPKFFAWNNGHGVEGKIGKCQDIERLARCEYPYYTQNHRIIAECVGFQHKWEHVDLFFNRESAQSKFKAKVFAKDTLDVLTPFGRQQLGLSIQLISEINPKVIVVVNKLAAKIFNCAFDVTFDLERHYCMTREKVPVLFAWFTNWRTQRIQKQRGQLIRDLQKIL